MIGLAPLIRILKNGTNHTFAINLSTLVNRQPIMSALCIVLRSLPF